MGKLDSSPDFDGIRDILDSKTSTSGGSGSVSMSEQDTRDRVTRKNDAGFIGNGSAPHYNPGTATEARQAKDFRRTVRCTTRPAPNSWSTASTKSSITQYLYGWGTSAGVTVATQGNMTTAGGALWDGQTNYTSTARNMSDWGGSVNLEFCGKIVGVGTEFATVWTSNPNSAISYTDHHTRQPYTNGTTFPGGTDTVGSTNQTMNSSVTYGGVTRWWQRYGGGIYSSFAASGVPSSTNSAFYWSVD